MNTIDKQKENLEMKSGELLNFLVRIEKIKSNTRHLCTSNGTYQTVAFPDFI